MTRLRIWAVILALGIETAADEHALSTDKTGIGWVVPYAKLRKESRKRKRLMLLVPIAGGTNKTGDW